MSKSKAKDPKRVKSIPIDQIRFLNPRVRNRRNFQEIVQSIANVGLKRPITVSPRKSEADSATPRGRGWCQGVSIRPVPREDLHVKHSRKSRSITSWVSISSWDGPEFTTVPGRHPCSREIPQRTSAVIGGL